MVGGAAKARGMSRNKISATRESPLQKLCARLFMRDVGSLGFASLHPIKNPSGLIHITSLSGNDSQQKHKVQAL